ncbi:hypothetical protein [Methylosinus sp. PW1]|uniref:hypothetical protein n=1 Tax=Methylosinus sp. PW1 TaxID=107636 RepID=UPI0018DB8FD4|nr:hypothetical protein [Methylosinus sp. PW1]
MSNRENHKSDTTHLPTIRSARVAELSPGDSDLLFKLYEQTCTTWRMLVDVRFKLLALVPTASLLSLATVIGSGEPSKFIAPQVRILFSVLGLMVTLGLLIYDLRNSELHNDLIIRGRKIEDELGVDTGVFRGRLEPQKFSLIRHSSATNLIYGAAIVAWLAAIWISA